MRWRTVKIKATIQMVDQDGNVMKPHRRRLRRVRCIALILVADEAFAWKLRDQLTRGESSFSELAQAHSQMPGEPNGVMLGGKLIPELETAIGRLRSNEVSEPVQTEFGWCLIQRRGPRWTFD